MPTWQDLLKRIIIFDGAMGTMLQAAGLDLGRCPELWNLESPDVLRRIHSSYVTAGAMVIETNSFGGNSIKLKEYGLAEKTLEINRRAAQLAKEAAGEKALVAGSVGPTGLLMEPYGTAAFDDFYQAFALQIRGLAEGGADLICIETMSDLGEIRAALIAAKDACALPVVCTMTFDKSGKTMMGISPEMAAYVLASLGADAIGANCSMGPDGLLPVIQRMAQAVSLPIMVQPNAGLPVMRDGQVYYDETPSSMAGFIDKFVEAGARILGGCCGTRPEHIQAIARAAKDLTPVARSAAEKTVLAGRRKLVIAEESSVPVLIGRRNPALDDDSLANDSTAKQVEAILAAVQAQVEAGAQVVNLNVGFGSGEEPETMRQAVIQVQSSFDVPVAIDSVRPEVVESGLKAIKGKALLNAVTGEKNNMQELLPLAKKYGAIVRAVTVDENGLPEDAAGRIKIAEEIVKNADAVGIGRSELIIDVLTEALPGQTMENDICQAVSLFKEQQGVKTCLTLPAWKESSLSREEFLENIKKQGIDFVYLDTHKQGLRIF